MLTPLDLENIEFSRSFRGYSDDEVDDFLEKVSADYENLYKENLQLKDNMTRLQQELEHFQNIEQTLKNTLVLAEKTAEEVKKNAEKEAELLFKEARNKADAIIAEAEEKADNIYKRFTEVQEMTRILKIKLQSFLEAQLELVNDFPQKDENFHRETKISVG